MVRVDASVTVNQVLRSVAWLRAVAALWPGILRPTRRWRSWERSRPAVVLAPDPQAPFPLWNPDRAAVGYAAAHAAVGRGALLAARGHVGDDPQVLLYGTRRPNLLVEITEVLPEKLSAVKSHRSQLRGPDRLAAPVIRAASRTGRADTSAYYVEGFYRVL